MSSKKASSLVLPYCPLTRRGSHTTCRGAMHPPAPYYPTLIPKSPYRLQRPLPHDTLTHVHMHVSRTHSTASPLSLVHHLQFASNRFCFTCCDRAVFVRREHRDREVSTNWIHNIFTQRNLPNFEPSPNWSTIFLLEKVNVTHECKSSTGLLNPQNSQTQTDAFRDADKRWPPTDLFIQLWQKQGKSAKKRIKKKCNNLVNLAPSNFCKAHLSQSV